MDDNLPIPIYSDKDLLFYENYLNREFPSTNTENSYEYLNKFLKSIVKIDCGIGNRIESKIGILDSINEDFLVIIQNQKKCIILLKCVKFITVLRQNV